MKNRTFGSPIRWGIGPGPALLYSVDGAISAIQVWLELTPQLPATEREREWMLALRDVLGETSPDPSEAEMESARMAIEGMVEYSASPEADALRASSFMAAPKAA